MCPTKVKRAKAGRQQGGRGGGEERGGWECLREEERERGRDRERGRGGDRVRNTFGLTMLTRCEGSWVISWTDILKAVD